MRVLSREKLVRVSYRLAARYFLHEFLTSNRACSISCKFLMRVFGASFSYEFLVRVFRASVMGFINCRVDVDVSRFIQFLYTRGVLVYIYLVLSRHVC